MRKSTVFLAFLLGCGATLAALFAAGAATARTRGPVLARIGGLVGTVGLTDLALFTEARYTRHLSQADLHSAFQDHPLSLDHFPTGSLAAPPARLRRTHAPAAALD